MYCFGLEAHIFNMLTHLKATKKQNEAFTKCRTRYFPQEKREHKLILELHSTGWTQGRPSMIVWLNLMAYDA